MWRRVLVPILIALDCVPSIMCGLVDDALGLPTLSDISHLDSLDPVRALDMDDNGIEAPGFLGHGLPYVNIDHRGNGHLLGISTDRALLEVQIVIGEPVVTAPDSAIGGAWS